MKLDKLTVTNFRQFYGRQQISFSKSESQNTTVIHGVNGAGKTSLFTAINWCLYGAGAENIGSLINKEAVAQAAVGATLQAVVELAFTHSGERYLATRKIFADKLQDGTSEVDPRIQFTLMRTDMVGQAQSIDNPIGVLNSILSSKVRTYFFFDGEKIDNFAKPEASDEVREAIYNVLGLEIVTRGRRHLDEVAAALRREWKKSATGLLSTLLDEEIAKRAEIDKLKGRQVELEQEITAAKRHLGSIEEQLRQLEATRHLQEKLDMLRGQMESLGEERTQLISRIRDYTNQGYVVLAQEMVRGAMVLIDERRERGEIPSNIREQLVHDLLQKQVCICGRSFSYSDETYKHLEHLLETAVSGALEDDVLNTSALLRALPGRATEMLTNLSMGMSRKVQVDAHQDSLYAQADDVMRQVKGSDQGEIQTLALRRDQYMGDIEQYQVEKGQNTTKLEMLNREISELEKDIAKARKAEAAAETMGRRVELAQQAADALEAIYEAFAEDRRERIQGEAQSIFHKLVWKDSHFRGMSLDRDYKLEVYDHWGQPARPELSAGERQVLSLAFIMAMAEVSEEEAPLVMDTPFGRLSSAHRDNITTYIPDMADQLVLFVTDEELRGQALENLRPYIGAEYRLDFDRNTSCTTIEEVR